MSTAADLDLDTVTLERDGHVLVMGLNRPDKRNAFNLAMLADLSRAYALLESDDTLRAGVLVAHGDHFTAGLDLVHVGPAIAGGRDPFPADGRDPCAWTATGPSRWWPPHRAAA
jgi:enoyl-CoA hydratase